MKELRRGCYIQLKKDCVLTPRGIYKVEELDEKMIELSIGRSGILTSRASITNYEVIAKPTAKALKKSRKGFFERAEDLRRRFNTDPEYFRECEAQLSGLH